MLYKMYNRCGGHAKSRYGSDCEPFAMLCWTWRIGIRFWIYHVPQSQITEVVPFHQLTTEDRENRFS
jgi:hypothetical protein